MFAPVWLIEITTRMGMNILHQNSIRLALFRRGYRTLGIRVSNNSPNSITSLQFCWIPEANQTFFDKRALFSIENETPR